MRQSPILFAVLLLTGCHLIEQRTFDPNAERKPKPPAAKVAAGLKGAGPLVVIRYTTPDPAYAPELAVAVKQAIARKPNVLFTIETLIPPAPSAAAQESALREAAATGREIAEAILADGADPGQTEIAVRVDLSVKVKEVRVSVH